MLTSAAGSHVVHRFEFGSAAAAAPIARLNAIHFSITVGTAHFAVMIDKDLRKPYRTYNSTGAYPPKVRFGSFEFPSVQLTHCDAKTLSLRLSRGKLLSLNLTLPRTAVRLAKSGTIDPISEWANPHRDISRDY